MNLLKKENKKKGFFEKILFISLIAIIIILSLLLIISNKQRKIYENSLINLQNISWQTLSIITTRYDYDTYEIYQENFESFDKFKSNVHDKLVWADTVLYSYFEKPTLLEFSYMYLFEILSCDDKDEATRKHYYELFCEINKDLNELSYFMLFSSASDKEKSNRAHEFAQKYDELYMQ